MISGGIIAFAVGAGIGLVIQIVQIFIETSAEIYLLDNTSIDTVDVKSYTQSCIEWCSENLGGHPPILKYSRAKPTNTEQKKILLGTYDFNSEVVTMYTLRHENLREYTNTVIHEYQHHIQKLNGVTQNKYSRYEYETNPFEFECNRVADAHTLNCGIYALKKLQAA
jgi:hypothetical protein